MFACLYYMNVCVCDRAGFRERILKRQYTERVALKFSGIELGDYLLLSSRPERQTEYHRNSSVSSPTFAACVSGLTRRFEGRRRNE